MLRTFFAFLLLAALSSPAWACDGAYGRTAYRGFARPLAYGNWRGRYRVYRAPRAPYWHHPYYLRRYAGLRPYVYNRFVRHHGFYPQTVACGYGGGFYGGGFYGGYFTYYARFVTVAPIYSRLGVALTIDGPEFDGEAPKKADADGLPRERKTLVGERFLVKK